MSIDLSAVDQLLKMGSKATTIIDQLSRDKKYAKPIKEALSLGFSPSTILDNLTGTPKRKPQSVFTPEENIARTDIERREKQERAALKGATGLATLGLAAAKLPKAIQSATGALGGALGDALGDIIPKKPQPPEGLEERQALKEKISRLPSEKEQTRETLSTDFPQLEQAVRKLAISGVKEKEAYDRIVNMRLYAPLVKRYEESGRSFKEKIRDVYQSLKPQRQRAARTSTLEKLTGGSMLDRLTSPDAAAPTRQSSEKESLLRDLQRLKQLLGE